VTVKLKYCSPEYKLLQYRQNSIDYENKLQLVIDNKLRNIKYQMDMYIEKLNGLSPVNKLKSGYSMVTSKDKIVKSVEVIEKGDEVNIALLDGEIVAKVDKVIVNNRMQIRGSENV
jgi:exodeoxyribonuclease VII large subunit